MSHYLNNTMQDIEYILQDLPAREANCLFNVLKYFERRNNKGCHDLDMDKARDYAHRLVYGRFRNE